MKYFTNKRFLLSLAVAGVIGAGYFGFNYFSNTTVTTQAVVDGTKSTEVDETTVPAITTEKPITTQPAVVNEVPVVTTPQVNVEEDKIDTEKNAPTK